MAIFKGEGETPLKYTSLCSVAAAEPMRPHTSTEPSRTTPGSNHGARPRKTWAAYIYEDAGTASSVVWRQEVVKRATQRSSRD